MNDDEWEFIYAESTASQEPDSRSSTPRSGTPRSGTPRRALRGVSTLNPTSVRRKLDGKTFAPGDFVLLQSDEDEHPYVGMIHDFSFGTKGFMEVRTMWFTHPEHVLPKKNRRKDTMNVSELRETREGVLTLF